MTRLEEESALNRVRIEAAVAAARENKLPEHPKRGLRARIKNVLRGSGRPKVLVADAASLPDSTL